MIYLREVRYSNSIINTKLNENSTVSLPVFFYAFFLILPPAAVVVPFARRCRRASSLIFLVG